MTARLRRLLQRWLPRSLLGRMLALTLLAVVLAQGISSAIWFATYRAQEMEGLLQSSRSLAYSVAATTRFFQKLPPEYRNIVLDQLRNMGGTRFFVSLNEKAIPLKALPDTERKGQVIAAVRDVLTRRLGEPYALNVEFVAPDNLRVFNSEMKLKDLPRSWANYALKLAPINPPVLVTQIEIAPDEWLYLAAMLPAPYVSLEDQGVPTQQIFFITLMTLFLLSFIALLVRWQTRPLRRLAYAARDMPVADSSPPLTEQGSSEIVAVTRAYNAMRSRIQRYLNDREQLFSAISHDLRTPITRLRLRTEMLDDESLRSQFESDLSELDLLVKGALQSVKDVDIHENIEAVNMNQLVDMITGPSREIPGQVTITGAAHRPYRGKPLALKRCLGNLFDNALKYGRRVHIRIDDSDARLTLHFDDQGPGIPEAQLERIFEPYYRLRSGQIVPGHEEDNDQSGYGLGLGIARNIAHAHGGELRIKNRAEGGLRVSLYLPRNG